MSALRLFNRQKIRAINTALLRRIAAELLAGIDGPRELAVHLVEAPEMTRLNETFLRHKGSTDVITFDYREDAPDGGLSGEIFICIDEAVAQARRFRVTWQAEVARYLVHGILHLQGYDDRKLAPRRAMKREENQRVKKLSQRHDLRALKLNEHARK